MTDSPTSAGTRAGQPAPAADAAALEVRIHELEAERRRVFEDAQREADAVFAQYQLSQLLAAGGSVDEMAAAVLAEVARAVGAAGRRPLAGRPGDDDARARRPPSPASAETIEARNRRAIRRAFADARRGPRAGPRPAAGAG